MEFELDHNVTLTVLAALLLIALILFGAVGAFVTPKDGSDPQWLTPARWTSFKLQKTVRKETEKLVRDAERLQQLLENEQPDPIAAMLLAQEVYATHRDGSPTTAAARSALMQATEAAVRASVGEIPRDEAVAAYHQAAARIKALTPTTGPPSSPTPTPSLQFLPSIQAP